MQNTINIQQYHTCDRLCKKILSKVSETDCDPNCFDLEKLYSLVDNPSYDQFTKKCSKYGQKEDASIPLKEYHENPSNFQLFEADKIIIHEKNIRILFEYPLKNPKLYQVSSDNGFTLKNLIDIIVAKYYDIYREDKIYGTYSIWIHEINDLFIEGLTYTHSLELLNLSIGS